MKKLIYLLAVVSMLVSCEDIINPNLIEAEPIIVIDAWVTNKNEPQNILVTSSQQYFENVFPSKVPNATVYIVDNNGERFDFIENDSAYTWVPTTETFGQRGNEYLLTVEVGGETYNAAVEMGRAPVIDSIKFAFNPADNFIEEDYYTGEFVATDFVGEGDTYWIKSFRNNVFLSKPNEINVAYDAGFSRGGNIDGLVFIQPIQDGVNPFDEDPENDNEFIPPYSIGDELYVEIHSISQPAFFFLNEVIIQTDRQGGFGALFAQPLANVSTNIINADTNADKQVLGFFNVGEVTYRRQVLTEEIAQMAKDAEEE